MIRRRWKSGIVLVVLAAVCFGGLAFRFGPQRHSQPIAFNHKRHLEEDIACKDCHKRVEDGPYATFPSVRGCLVCHEEPTGKHPDEPKIREYAKDGGEIPWVQVNRLPGHVYFSHAAHVKWGKMDCNECHGSMKERSEPVTTSQIGHLDMKRCMECHESKRATTDCIACHK